MAQPPIILLNEFYGNANGSPDYPTSYRAARIALKVERSRSSYSDIAPYLAVNSALPTPMYQISDVIQPAPIGSSWYGNQFIRSQAQYDALPASAFLYSDSARTQKIAHTKSDNYVYADPADPAYRAMVVTSLNQTIQDLPNIASMIYLDNIHASLDKIQRTYSGITVYKGTTRDGSNTYTDQSYADAWIGFLNYLRANVTPRSGQTLVLMINLIEQNDTTDWTRYSAVDGILDEGFVGYPYNGSYWSAARVTHAITQAQAWLALSSTNFVALISQTGSGQTGNRAQMEYCLAAALMAYPTGAQTFTVNGRAIPRWTFRDTQINSYGYWREWNTYDLALGAPTGAATQVGNVWSRAFANATVSADLGARSGTLGLSGGGGGGAITTLDYNIPQASLRTVDGNTQRLTKITTGARDQYVQSISLWLDFVAGVTGSQPIKALLRAFDTSGNLPSTLLATDAGATIAAGGTAGYYEFVLPTPILLSATTSYAVGYHAGAGSSGSSLLRVGQQSSGATVTWQGGDNYTDGTQAVWSSVSGQTTSTSALSIRLIVWSPLITVAATGFSEGTANPGAILIEASIDGSDAPPPGATLTLPFTLRGGSAIAGIDYTERSGSLIWQAGQAGTRTVAIPFISDGVKRGDKTVEVVWGTPSFGTVLTPDPITVTVTDSDGAAAVTPTVANASAPTSYRSVAQNVARVGRWFSGPTPAPITAIYLPLQVIADATGEQPIRAQVRRENTTTNQPDTLIVRSKEAIIQAINDLTRPVRFPLERPWLPDANTWYTIGTHSGAGSMGVTVVEAGQINTGTVGSGAYATDLYSDGTSTTWADLPSQGTSTYTWVWELEQGVVPIVTLHAYGTVEGGTDDNQGSIVAWLTSDIPLPATMTVVVPFQLAASGLPNSITPTDIAFTGMGYTLVIGPGQQLGGEYHLFTQNDNLSTGDKTALIVPDQPTAGLIANPAGVLVTIADANPPAVPEALQVVTRDSTSILLAFGIRNATGVTQITGRYRVAGTTPWTTDPPRPYSPDEQEYLFGGLTPDTTYELEIGAIVGAGSPTWSATFTIATLPGPPSSAITVDSAAYDATTGAITIVYSDVPGSSAAFWSLSRERVGSPETYTSLPPTRRERFTGSQTLIDYPPTAGTWTYTWGSYNAFGDAGAPVTASITVGTLPSARRQLTLTLPDGVQVNLLKAPYFAPTYVPSVNVPDTDTLTESFTLEAMGATPDARDANRTLIDRGLRAASPERPAIVREKPAGETRVWESRIYTGKLSNMGDVFGVNTKREVLQRIGTTNSIAVWERENQWTCAEQTPILFRGFSSAPMTVRSPGAELIEPTAFYSDRPVPLHYQITNTGAPIGAVHLALTSRSPLLVGSRAVLDAAYPDGAYVTNEFVTNGAAYENGSARRYTWTGDALTLLGRYTLDAALLSSAGGDLYRLWLRVGAPIPQTDLRLRVYDGVTLVHETPLITAGRSDLISLGPLRLPPGGGSVITWLGNLTLELWAQQVGGGTLIADYLWIEPLHSSRALLPITSIGTPTGYTLTDDGEQTLITSTQTDTNDGHRSHLASGTLLLTPGVLNMITFVVLDTTGAAIPRDVQFRCWYQDRKRVI